MLTKGEEVRYISHLDYAKAVERALRRSKLPIAYTEGFNPHMKISFASALAVGVSSSAEYIDVELTEKVDLEKVLEDLASSFGKGIKLLQASYVEKRGQALAAAINLATYEVAVFLDKYAHMESVYDSLNNFNFAESVLFTKESPKTRRQIDIKNFMAEDVGVSKKSAQEQERHLILNMSIKITPHGSVKPADVLGILVDTYHLPVDKHLSVINRTGLYIEKDNVKILPIDFI